MFQIKITGHFEVSSAIRQHLHKIVPEKPQGLWGKWGEGNNIQKNPINDTLKKKNGIKFSKVI